jgi:hypothetical protein
MTAAIAMMMAGGRRRFLISPEVSGKATWDLDVDGPLNLGTAGSWTLTPLSSFRADVKGWGAGTIDYVGRVGTVGGACAGRMQFHFQAPYTLSVGQPGGWTSISPGAPGGGSGGSAGSAGVGGGGYSGLRLQGGPAKLIAGAGGGNSGGAGGSRGGAGGGLEGKPGGGGTPGFGATQEVGDLWQGANGAGPPFDSGGGGGGGGYRGGGGGGFASGGGGGSGYADPRDVTEATMFAGDDITPGNAADPDRAGAGGVGAAGRVIIY